MNAEQAVRLTAVYRAVHIIADAIAASPLHLYQNHETHREVVKPAVFAALWGVPNGRHARMDFWSTEGRAPAAARQQLPLHRGGAAAGRDRRVVHPTRA